jgi:hypothetical protein
VQEIDDILQHCIRRKGDAQQRSETVCLRYRHNKAEIARLHMTTRTRVALSSAEIRLFKDDTDYQIDYYFEKMRCSILIHIDDASL